MVSSGDAETGPEVVDDSPCGSWQTQRCPVGTDETSERYANNEGDIEPVDMLVPILPSDGVLCDMFLGRVVLGASVWLVLAGHWGRLRGQVLGVDGLVASGGLVRRHDESLLSA